MLSQIYLTLATHSNVLDRQLGTKPINNDADWNTIIYEKQQKQANVILVRFVVSNYHDVHFRTALARHLKVPIYDLQIIQVLRKRIITLEINPPSKQVKTALNKFLVPLRLSEKPVNLDNTSSIIFARILQRPPTNWGYTWVSGLSPTNWANTFPICAGSLQSPIDITMATVQTQSSSQPLSALYVDSPAITMSTIRNTGSTLALDLNEDVVRLMGGPLTGRYILETVEFHWDNTGNGSEHTLDGHRAAMEMQFIFYQANYGDVYSATQHQGVAIMSALFKLGQSNPELEKIIDKFPGIQTPGSEEPIYGNLFVEKLYGGSDFLKTFYTYNGSRTSPPCTEGIKWIVLSKNSEISSQQLEKFKLIQLNKQTNGFEKNWRPAKPLQGRKVIKFNSPILIQHKKEIHQIPKENMVWPSNSEYPRTEIIKEPTETIRELSIEAIQVVVNKNKIQKKKEEKEIEEIEEIEELEQD